MNISVPWPADILERMARAVDEVQQRLRCDRNSEGTWKQESAVRRCGRECRCGVGCQNRRWGRCERPVTWTYSFVAMILKAVKAAMKASGFEYAFTSGIHLFIEPNGKPSEGIHLLFAEEKVNPLDPVPAPALTESERGAAFQVLSLEALVRMKLVAFRLKDQVHLQDMVRHGLIDATWPERFPEVLAERLRQILANPDG